MIDKPTGSDYAKRLKEVGVPVTLQRLALARALFDEPCHVTAEQLMAKAHENMPSLSRATVYNTLRLFAAKGLVRELVVDSERVVFDSTIAPHHHFYNVDTGEVSDVPDGDLEIRGMSVLPDGMEIENIDVFVRIRQRQM